ncbi:MAG: sigma-70 family RNA polymerase sigma factor [Proteobacteria bacterium]|nr:sigma-70 family RNA polymerase sigma factor [Pseudomonadota bacterium]MBU6424891.1 sigma-70 family RNA polymerase sigma factor [Rhodospirillales bacterium]
MSTLETPPPDAAALAALILRVSQKRDRTAYAALFKHFAPRVKAYLRRVGLDGAEAEEVTQEVMLSLWRKADSFDPAIAGAATWIFAITRNARIDLARRRRGLPTTPEPEEEGHSPSAEALTLAYEREALVRAALDTLSTEQQQIVRLSFFSETPHVAIADALGLPLGTVKSRIRLGLAKLRAALEDKT